MRVTVYDDKGNVVEKGGSELLPAGSDNKSNCHGTTFANGQVWIGNSQVPNLLKGDGYTRTDAPKSGDVGTYSRSGYENEHSVKVDAVNSKGKVTDVTSKGGITPRVSNVLPAPGPNTAWNRQGATLVYYTQKPNEKKR